jgi:acyl-CoA oxidase
MLHVTPQGAQGRILPQRMQIGDAIKDLCRSLGAESVAIAEGFGIPDHLLAAPIAADWDAYNKVDNQGELTGVSMAW